MPCAVAGPPVVERGIKTLQRSPLPPVQCWLAFFSVLSLEIKTSLETLWLHRNFMESRGFGLPVWTERNATWDFIMVGLSHSARKRRRHIVATIVTHSVHLGGILVGAVAVYVVHMGMGMRQFRTFLKGLSKEETPSPPVQCWAIQSDVRGPFQHWIGG